MEVHTLLVYMYVCICTRVYVAVYTHIVTMFVSAIQTFLFDIFVYGNEHTFQVYI